MIQKIKDIKLKSSHLLIYKLLLPNHDLYDRLLLIVNYIGKSNRSIQDINPILINSV